MCNERGGWGDGCGCEKNLKVNKLCAKCAKIQSLEAHDIVADNECVSGDLQASSVHAGELFTNKLCAKEGTVNKLCVDDLTVTNFNPCQPFRASATFSANSVYSLGSDINWNLVLDDPSSDIALAPFSYTVPATGYYVFNFQLNSFGLSGAAPLIGAPIGVLELDVNGSKLLASQTAYLTFAGVQNANLGGLVLLNAGDVLKMKYDVLFLDPVLGLTTYVGTVNIQANGAFPNSSSFSIHYLSSSLCTPEPGQACEVCPTVVVECAEDPCCPKPGLMAPHLNAIMVDPASPSDYTVSWSAVPHATSYTLEQSLLGDFSDAMIVAQGNMLSKAFVGQANGTYWYRVFASNAADNSPYSKVKSVMISGALAARPAAARPAARPAAAGKPAARPRSNWVRPR